MKPINGQSGLIHMIDQPRTPVRYWLIQAPPSMFVPGRTVDHLAGYYSIKRFTSVRAFEGYVRQVLAMGMTVLFDNPFSAVVEASA